ncbi:Coatomer subunit beta [Dermatophagoides pteronyssinus]|uniref:Coatomer subunit beta n=1 Tax=Dermatophagoides pteronyssinus TaxID=6956 RepID=A0ABQ8J5G6_DERPT|nr:Coatomer subunit beta [Dermatophagoides pteronyssinus]
MAESICYTLINVETDDTTNEVSIRNDIEKGDTKSKITALKKLIYIILNGEKFPPNMLMFVIRYLLPSNDHQIKKLLLIFWEIVPKRGPDGKLLHEMILVCDAYRKDLQHPNEYLRGSTLRFLCKLKEPELLEPLLPTIRQCLEHRHSYVRRNAVLAIFKIYMNFEFLIPDAPELVLDFLGRESDASCKRNAFLMLIHLDQKKALDYLNSCLEQIGSFNEILQLVIVELIYKVCISNPGERSKFIRAIYNLLSMSTSASVRYEAAATLVTLSQAPTALKAAANCFIDICIKESDNNVKLIVLDRLISLKDSASGAERILQDSLMDILRILNVATDLEVKQKVLNLSLDLVNLRNVEELVQLLKKEILKTQNESHGTQEENSKYCQMLVKTIHVICMKYPDVINSSNVLTTLFELLATKNDEATAILVIVFCRQFISKNAQLKNFILNKLMEVFASINNVKVHRGLIWLLGEFCDENAVQLQEVLELIKTSMGELPIVESELRKLDDGNEDNSTYVNHDASKTLATSSAPKLVTADGSYATQSALSLTTKTTTNEQSQPPLRRYMLVNNEFFIGTTIANCLVKLSLRYKQMPGVDQRSINVYLAESMLLLTSILHLGKSKLVTQMINEDDYERISLSLYVLININNMDTNEIETLMNQIYLHDTRQSLMSMLDNSKECEIKYDSVLNKTKKAVEIDDHLIFSQLINKATEQMENLLDVSLNQAIAGPTATSTASGRSSSTGLLSASQLSKVTQLTGLGDPVYAECYVNVNQYDISLDVLIVNQTSDTLQNCTLELSTIGDLKLVEKPQPIVLAPHDFTNVRASIKVTSTENVVIFGNIVYDISGSTSDRNVVVLNDIYIDIMDYIIPATCSDAQFRQMWTEFEWENKVTVNTGINDLIEYLNHLIKSTNMKCLTPQKSLSGNCGFLAANLYAKSIFGEDALANVSIEKTSLDAPVTGHIRIRAKSQGMALSLGDKINTSQKMAKAA